MDVSAILNDTTGCLMSCAWKNPKCRIGLIIGTGTNACYLEDMDNVSGSKNVIRGHPKRTVTFKMLISSFCRNFAYI